MEHLPLPEGVEPFITVPYYAPDKSDWYDCKGHEGYPERMGWTKDNLLGQGEDGSPFGKKSGHARDDAAIERFFQTWLYFGTAIEFFKVGGQALTTESFVYPAEPGMAHIVQTKYLRMYLVELWSKSTRDKETLWKEVTPILERTLFYLNRFCQEPHEKHPSDRRKTVTWPVRDEISTSIIALVFSLIQAAIHKCDKGIERFPTPFLARSEILYKRIERKWCLADATRFEDEMEFDGHYFLAASPGLPDEEIDNHIHCTRDQCHYTKDEKTYVTRHAPPPWHHAGCESAVWGGQYGGVLRTQKGGVAKDWVDSVCKIIGADAIPIVLWSVSERKYFTVEFHKEGKLRPKFVAISHVWADGKGNPFENSLPVCQLENIQDMVEKIRFDGRKPPVAKPYSDGIGFWIDTLCIPVADEHKKLRTKAIKDMRYLYENASAVLILDEWIRQISWIAPAPAVLARVYQCNWIKRLWTHQEGFFPKELWVQFSDQAVKIEAITDKADDYEKSMIPKGIYLRFPNIVSWKVPIQYFFFSMAYRNMGKDKAKIYGLYGPLADIMRLRRTSRQGDECVCLATILGLELDPYLAIENKPDAEAANKRMQILLKDINKFQRGLIFNSWERLKVPGGGFGWAPKTLLGHRGGRDNTEIGVWDQKISEIQWDGNRAGLPVEYPGFASFNFSKATRFSINSADRAFVVQLENGDNDFDLPFVVEVFPNDITWDKQSKYAIILSKVPEEGEEGVLAVIGSASTHSGDVIAFTHLCLASIRMLNPPKVDVPDWIDSVVAYRLPEDTKWLVL